MLSDTVPMNGSSRAGRELYERGGLFGRIFNRPVVLVAILLLCLAVLIYAFMPLGQDQLYERGALMETGSVYDMSAWTEYLEPLETRFPEHPYQERSPIFAANGSGPGKSAERAQRFFQQGELLAKQGNTAAAMQTCAA